MGTDIGKGGVEGLRRDTGIHVIGYGGRGRRNQVNVVCKGGITAPPDCVREIVNIIDGAEEVGGAVDITHRQGEVEAGEVLGVRQVGEDDEGDVWDVLQANTDAYVCIGQIHIGEEGRDEGRIFPENVKQEASQNLSKLHQLRGEAPRGPQSSARSKCNLQHRLRTERTGVSNRYGSHHCLLMV